MSEKFTQVLWAIAHEIETAADNDDPGSCKLLALALQDLLSGLPISQDDDE